MRRRRRRRRRGRSRRLLGVSASAERTALYMTRAESCFMLHSHARQRRRRSLVYALVGLRVYIAAHGRPGRSSGIVQRPCCSKYIGPGRPRQKPYRAVWLTWDSHVHGLCRRRRPCTLRTCSRALCAVHPPRYPKVRSLGSKAFGRACSQRLLHRQAQTRAGSIATGARARALAMAAPR